jgi:O-antigen ligase
MDQRPRLRSLLTYVAGAITTTPLAPIVLVGLGVGSRAHRRAGILTGSIPFLTLLLVVAALSTPGHTSLLVAGAIVALAVASDHAAARLVHDATSLAFGLAAGLAVAGALAVLQVFGGGMERAQGLFTHPNVFGGMIAPLLLFTAGILMRSVHRRRFVVLAGMALLLGFVALALSGSRGAYLGTVVGAFVLVRPSASRGRGRTMLLCIVATAAAVFLMFPTLRAPVVARLVEVGDASDASGRSYIWALTMEAVALRPFLGHGWNGFVRAIEGVDPAFRTDRTHHAHSLYLQLLLDGGWLTLLAFGYWWLRLIRSLLRRAAIASSLAGPSLAAIACLAVHNLFEPLLYHGPIAASALLIVGIGLGGCERRTWVEPPADVARVGDTR